MWGFIKLPGKCKGMKGPHSVKNPDESLLLILRYCFCFQVNDVL